MFLADVAPIAECKNPDSYGMICVKCNKCGRYTTQIKCLICKKERTIHFGVLPRGWDMVELYDSAKEPVCTQCKKQFADEELIVKDKNHVWEHQVVGKHKKDFE